MSDAGKLLSRWRADPSVADNITAWERLPAMPAEWAALPDGIHPALKKAMLGQGILQLFSHQLCAWQAVRSREHLAVVTGTASGKTLCYNLPVLDQLLADGNARALYLFPTKALAQDQLSNLQAMGLPAVSAAIYDGDTLAHARPAIRRNARLVLSNPDMLHTGILPHHTIWADFFRNLRFVVIDEMHAYRGVFGSHVANVLRRLRRVARFYGSDPRFILASATIANPHELAKKLVEAPVTVIDHDGASRGARSFLIYNPPVVNPELGLRRSAIQESVRLADDLLAYGLQTVIFGRSRRGVELVLTYLRQQASADRGWGGGPAGEREIRGYRSGYLPQERRQIEHGLRSGQVRAVVATNALELGIDIGAMGASLLVGYPGSIAATWQQAGRAGRRDDLSVAVMVATADPLDQFLAHHPEFIFQRTPEQGLVNPDNLLILLNHLRCAAFELPFQAGEPFGSLAAEQTAEFLDFLQAEGVLHQSNGRYFWMSEGYPAQQVSLRSASPQNVVLQVSRDGHQTSIGEVDYTSAHWMVHPGAVYLHEAQSYLVEELDLENKIAHLNRQDGDYYTEPRRESSVALLELLDKDLATGCGKYYGEIRVTNQVIGYRMVKWYTHEQLGIEPLDLPPTSLDTTGYWLALQEVTIEKLRQSGLWRSDPNIYGPGWQKRRAEVRLRDGYRCQVCGAAEGGREHDVHHITPLRTFQETSGMVSYERANRMENLITLCPTCHHRAETAVRVRSGLAGLAFVLGHLAPLFLMCDSRDLGVHADPQSPLCDGQPAVVIYDQVPAGIGLSQHLFSIHAELLMRAQELVMTCECLDGCPSCVGPGGELGMGGKQETLAILSELVSEG
jgi:DEAD/DEAH box helicase domain-containing protein